MDCAAGYVTNYYIVVNRWAFCRSRSPVLMSGHVNWNGDMEYSEYQ